MVAGGPTVAVHSRACLPAPTATGACATSHVSIIGAGLASQRAVSHRTRPSAGRGERLPEQPAPSASCSPQGTRLLLLQLAGSPPTGRHGIALRLGAGESRKGAAEERRLGDARVRGAKVARRHAGAGASQGWRDAHPPAAASSMINLHPGEIGMPHRSTQGVL